MLFSAASFRYLFQYSSNAQKRQVQTSLDFSERELITPPLDKGLILRSITRRSILELARDWNEFKVSERNITMNDILRLAKENRVSRYSRNRVVQHTFFRLWKIRFDYVNMVAASRNVWSWYSLRC